MTCLDVYVRVQLIEFLSDQNELAATDVLVFVGVWACLSMRSLLLWRGGLVVGRRTCDLVLVVAGSRPGRDAAA